MTHSTLLCGSQRLIDGRAVQCNRQFGHPITQRHRAILEDGTLIIWDGGYSSEIVPREIS